jgi:hypothetical protein
MFANRQSCRVLQLYDKKIIIQVTISIERLASEQLPLQSRLSGFPVNRIRRLRIIINDKHVAYAKKKQAIL